MGEIEIQLLTPAEAAQRLGVGSARVRQLADARQLPAMRTLSGRRLFRREDVERLARQRETRRTKKDEPR